MNSWLILLNEIILKKILPFFSYLFHPLFIPLFGSLFYFYGHENYFAPFSKYLMLIQITLITILVPLTFLYFLKVIGKVDSIMVSEASQRKIPMAMQLFLMAILLFKSITAEHVPELFYFFFGGMISTFLALFFLYLKTKVSLHMIGICSLTTFVIGLSIHDYSNWMLLIAGLLLMNGIVGSSRLHMKAHTGKELAIGFAIGLIPQLVLWRFWL